MSKSTQINLSALFSVLAMGFLAPVFADELGRINVQELRQAPGSEGVGFGALVLPSTHELGQLSATLYNGADQSIAMLTGSLSLYVPIAEQREQFGGFRGSLRQLPPPSARAHPRRAGASTTELQQASPGGPRTVSPGLLRCPLSRA